MPFSTSSLIKSLIILVLLLFALFSLAHAQNIDEIKSKIEITNSAIQKLEKEINQYQNEINSLSDQKNTLSNSIKSLDLSKRKLIADTKITENKISAKNLEIKELSLQIGDKNTRIKDSKRIITHSIYNISQINSSSLIENLLSKKTLSEIWNDSNQLNVLQGSIQERIKELMDLKESLENNKKQTEKKKKELASLVENLKNQTKIIADNVAEKNVLLNETKNTESGYKKLLATRQAQKDAFEKDLTDFESTLKAIIDPKSFPIAQRGIINWPLDKIRITQYFGITSFSPKIPHNGMDFATAVGTPVKSVLPGVITGEGDMDLAGGGKCRSYGKWILVKHNNGLSTLYAHLSLIKVKTGQNVSNGEIIAYSGNTGHSTGPHLHFSVYATEGVKISKLTNSNNCNNTPLPVAPRSAYLNPILYLPVN